MSLLQVGLLSKRYQIKNPFIRGSLLYGQGAMWNSKFLLFNVPLEHRLEEWIAASPLKLRSSI